MFVPFYEDNTAPPKILSRFPWPIKSRDAGYLTLVKLHDNLQGAVLRGVRESGVRAVHFTKLEPVRDQFGSVELSRAEEADQRRSGGTVHNARHDRDVLVPELLQPQLGWLAVYANVCDDTSSRDKVLAQRKRRRHAHGLNHGIDAPAAGECHDILRDICIGHQRVCRTHRPRHLKAVRIEVNHDDGSRRVEKDANQGAETDRPRADDRNGASGP